jgi:MFS family permease
VKTKFPFKLFLFAFFGWAFDFYDLVLLGFVKDDVAKSLHLGATGEAWMLGVALGTSGLGGIIAGALADRIGKRTMLAATIFFYSAGSLVSGLAPNVTVFLLGRAIVGLGVGGEWAIGHAMVAEAMQREARGRGSALLQSGEPVGVAIAAIVGYLIAPKIGWRAVMVASSATALIAVFARRSMHLPDEPVAKRRARRNSGGVGGRSPLTDDEKPQPRPKLEPAQLEGIASRLFRGWVLGVFKLGTYWTCYTWLPSFLVKQMHQSVGKSIAWMLSAQTGQLIGMLVFGQVSDRVGRRPAFAIFSLVTACAIAPLAFRWQTLSDKPPLFWATMTLLGFGSGCTAGFGALLAELFPTEVRGFAMGTTYNCARAAQILAPVVVSHAVAWRGLEGGLSVPLVLALGTATWVWTLPETRGITLPSVVGSQRRS